MVSAVSTLNLLLVQQTLCCERTPNEKYLLQPKSINIIFLKKFKSQEDLSIPVLFYKFSIANFTEINWLRANKNRKPGSDFMPLPTEITFFNNQR